MTSVRMFLLVLVLVAGIALSTDEEKRRIKCGQVLIKTLEVVCKYSGEQEDPTGITARSVPWPWLSNAARAGKDNMLIKQCCNDPCSMNDILAYC